MAELLFIATVIFVAYVVFVVIDDKKETPELEKVAEPEQVEADSVEIEPATDATITPETDPEPVPVPEPVVVKPVRTKATTAKVATVKTEPAKVAATKPEPNKTSEPAADSLKNPKTGEVAKFPSNYNFAKRWIKDSLVEEGLLEKVYKNTELDEATNEKIHAALLQLQALDKYK